MRLSVWADRNEIRADDSDLAFVDISLEDKNGNVASHLDLPVTIKVKGQRCSPLGSARPITEERFDGATHTTFDGRALAIIRPTDKGAIEVTVSAEDCKDVAIMVEAQ